MVAYVLSHNWSRHVKQFLSCNAKNRPTKAGSADVVSGKPDRKLTRPSVVSNLSPYQLSPRGRQTASSASVSKALSTTTAMSFR